MTKSPYDLILKSSDVLISDPQDPKKITRGPAEIALRHGKIVDIATDLERSGAPLYDVGSHTVLPGIIDSQVHFRDPGLTHKEDFASGTKGAVLGGVTAVFDMPNTKPNTSTSERYMEKLEICSSKAFCDFGLFVGATSENPPHLADIENLPGCCGIKIFMGSSTGDLLVSDDTHLENVLNAGKRQIAVHCEDENILMERASIGVEGAHPRAHPLWRNVESALSATQRIIALAHKTGRKIHVLHITTEEELRFLKENKSITTVECLPQHLFFSAPECYESMGSRAQMNPPIRDIRHQEALWEALQSGLIDVIGSDHAPHTLEEKAKTYPKSPSGMPGVQTILPVMLNFVNQGKLTLERMVHLLSINPAQIYKAQGKGGIYVGQDADFSIVDLQRVETIKDSMMATKSGWTPYHGQTVKGWPVATMIRGMKVMENGKILKENEGAPIGFEAP